jgi:hypothetical protein
MWPPAHRPKVQLPDQALLQQGADLGDPGSTGTRPELENSLDMIDIPAHVPQDRVRDFDIFSCASPVLLQN